MFLTILRCCYYLMSLLIVTFFLIDRALSEENPHAQARALLQRCVQTQSATDRISMKGLTEIFRDKLAPPDDRSRHQREEYWIRRDGPLLDYSSRYLFLDRDQDLSRNRREIIDRNYVLSTASAISEPSNGPAKGGIISTKLRERMLYGVVGDDTFGRLDGYFFGHRRLGEIMLEAQNLHFGREEVIGKTQCRIVEGITPYGKVKMWLAESKGCLPLKVTFEKGLGDMDDNSNTEGQDKPLSESRFPRGNNLLVPIVQKNGVLDSVEVQEFDKVFVPVSGHYIVTFKLSQGPDVVNEFIYKRTSIDLNPRFEGTDAFKINLVENAEVRNMDDPSSGVRYQWRDGKVVPAFSDFSGTAEGNRPGRSMLWIATWLVTGLLLLVFALRYIWRYNQRGA